MQSIMNGKRKGLSEEEAEVVYIAETLFDQQK